MLNPETKNIVKQINEAILRRKAEMRKLREARAALTGKGLPGRKPKSTT